MEAYCFKCRAKRELVNPKPIFFANGSPATEGTCPECGGRVFKMGRTPAHEGMTPPVVERKPRETKATSAKTKSKSTRSKGGDEASISANGKPLVIVESPTKARTIGKFLGGKFAVKPSVGHIRDLPKSRLGVDLEHDFEPTYIVPMAKRKTVKELKTLAKGAREVWLATDPDREGEAISWHLTKALEQELTDKPVRRVEFHEITPHAIDHAFKNPREIDVNLVNAQQARRILDRLVGYSLSPLVSDKLSRRGLSAGRVQSVALRLVCEREREIAAFVPVEYWTIEAELEKPSEGKSFVARLFKLNGKDPELHQESDARPIVDVLEKAAWNVFKVERKDRSRKPTAPFTTSTMQQEASRKLGFNARRTMGTAQSLYEGIDIGEGTVGLITYMRTDSVNIAESAQQEARQFISERYGEDFLPATPNKYTSRAKNAQEAHEAVRPTSAYRTPESIKQYLDKDQLRLYELIWQRFVASQMSNAIFDATTVDIEALPAGQSTSALTTADYTPMYWFRASGSIVKFIGFLKVYEESRDEGDAKNEDEDKDGKRLPELSMGDLLNLIRLIPEQHFTQPPPRFTEASLVKALEEYGIGRPSTYATIMTTIQSRNYVTREGKALRPTPLGFQVNDLLVGNFEHYVNVGFTAHIEDELDDIENGARTWQPVLHEFYDPFRDTVKVATSAIPKLERVIEYTGETCPKCGDGKLLYRESRNGKFIGCSNYPKCTHTAPLTMDGVTCPNCGGKLTERRARKGNRAFYGCVNYPTCEFTTWSKPLPIACPTGDGGLMVEAGKGKAKCLKCETVVELAD